VQPPRQVVDRFEWLSLCRLAADPYHHPAWVEASVARLRLQTKRPVDAHYLRVWDDDTLIGCPVIVIDGEMFNAPRSTPRILSGTPIVDPVGYMEMSVDVEFGATLVIHDDSALTDTINAAADRLRRTRTDVRQCPSMTGDDIDDIDAAIRWRNRSERTVWIDGLRRAARTSWTLLLDRCYVDDEPHGWIVTVHVTDPARPEVLAVATVGHAPHPWTSPR
jgi:hypothetical protein